MHRGDFTFISALQSLLKQTHFHRNKLKHNRASIAVIITPKQSKIKDAQSRKDFKTREANTSNHRAKPSSIRGAVTKL